MSAVPTLEWAGVDLPDVPDHERMQRHRGERLRATMAGSGIDALILLGGPNVAYATGATWPLAWAGRANVERPVAVVLLDDPMPHLFTPFMADAADELDLDDDHLHGPTYLDLAEGVEAFAHTIATFVPRTAAVAADEVTGAMRFLDAGIIDAGPALRAACRIKTDDEVAAIRAAVEVADVALAAGVAELRPGATEWDLTEAITSAMAAHGLTLPALGDTVRITSVDGDRACGPREPVRAGDLVAFHTGAVAGGYLGEVGRTWPVAVGRDDIAVAELYARSEDLWAGLLEACQPGAPASAILDAYRAAGEPLPVMPVGRGLGLGSDEPVVVRHLPETAAIERLDPGVVVALTGCVFDDAVGSVITHEVVRITAHGPEVLSASPTWSRDPAGARA